MIENMNLKLVAWLDTCTSKNRIIKIIKKEAILLDNNVGAEEAD